MLFFISYSPLASACSFCFLSFGNLCEYQDTNGFTSSVRQNNCTTDLLVSVTSVTTGSDVSLDGLVKFCNCYFFH